MAMQILLNALSAAGVYLLVGIGFGLSYSTARFFNFAYAIVFTSGAYFAYILGAVLKLPLICSILLSVPLAASLGGLVEVSVYRPLRRRGASSLALLLASLGVYIVLQNVISISVGDDTKSLGSGLGEHTIALFGARVSDIQVFIILASVASVLMVHALLRGTRIGLAMRAIASDRQLAAASGIDSERVYIWTAILGSMFAGMGGVLVALDVNMTPTMGMNALMMGIVAVIIGGTGSMPGIALGALLLGLSQHFGVWRIGSQWQDAIAFVILFGFLLFRPEGFLGAKSGRSTV